ncbi:DUF922 domain-containing protein [Olivibacter sp. SDN3]|uniref:DUF922 domain-containing protein n=1 Tax=Olivibacter sp. SDN3 TaxID=2764720 RepID=UPI0016513650|nr:DUF922 domain-containing protein [Olivibacter sp. SDN3]QNL49367.1 DUF922 domain-containing protein [Olivibacter sp. SDN3]
MVIYQHYRIIVCLLWLLLSAVITFAQGYRQLTEKDFRGTPDNKNPYLSNTKLRIGYRSSTVQKENIFQIKFEVYLDINQNESWIKFDKINDQRTLTALLKHEQGHFKLGALMQKELTQKLNNKKYTKHYKQEAATIFDRISQKYELLQLQYDQETQHMMDRNQQRLWDKKLDSLLFKTLH